MDAEEERSKAAHKQETREVQQGKRKQRGPERQRCSEAAYGQENQKVQQKREKAVHP